MSANIHVKAPETGFAMQLDIGSDHITVLVRQGQSAPVAHSLSIGAERIAQAYFKHQHATPDELENAIMVIEDALEGWRNLVMPDSRLSTHNPGIHEIARLAGLPLQAESVLSREAIEHTFQRLVAVAHGRPASAEGLPESTVFAARLLLLREFMHHMKFESITIKA